MDNADEEQFSEQVLDDLHYTVASNISCDMAKPKTQWEQQLSNNDNIIFYNCKDNNLMRFTFPITPEYYRVIVLRVESKLKSVRAEINLFQTGDIVPLASYPGCGVSDGKKSCSLKFGKKVHLSQTHLSLQINPDCTLYLLWLFKTEEDFIGK
ncbi:hypothetical protein V8C37DRAFT_397844 [Trichoderma ceciliae]